MMEDVGKHDDVVGLAKRMRIGCECSLAAQRFIDALDTVLRNIKTVHANGGQAVSEMLGEKTNSAAVVEQSAAWARSDSVRDVLGLVCGKVVGRLSGHAHAVTDQFLVVGGEGIEFRQRLLQQRK